jgi:hypothetical protein
MTVQQAAQQALQVQDACNISGVVRSMVQVIDAIRDGGTRSISEHPAVYLFAYKVMALTGHEPLDQWEAYGAAETACKAMAEVTA